MSRMKLQKKDSVRKVSEFRVAEKYAPALMARTLYNLNNAPFRIRLQFALAVMFKKVTC